MEVLSILSSETSPTRVANGGGVLPASFFAVEADSLTPPSEQPPPLPPREKATASPSVAAVLNYTPALVNDNLVIKSATTVTGQQQQPPSLRAGSVKSAAGSLRGSPPTGVIRQAAATSTTAPVHNAAAVTTTSKKLTQRRPSAGVLFGIKDKELPAPDTVKEVRKLFEQAGGGGGSFRGNGVSLTKSRSTSSLYTRPAAARTESLERLTAASRKKSEEDLLQLRNGGGGMASRRVPSLRGQPQQPPSITTKNNRSPSPRVSSGATSSYSPRRSPTAAAGSDSPSRTGRPVAAVSSPTTAVSSPAVGRPLIPAKPSHLSPIVVGRTGQAAPTAGFKPALGGGGSRAAPTQQQQRPVVKELDTVRLHPIGDKPALSSPQPVVHEVDAAAPINRRHREVEEEEGVKRISEAAILNIRKEAANVVNFNFNDNKVSAGGGKSHLPGVAASSPATDYRVPQTTKQACRCNRF